MVKTFTFITLSFFCLTYGNTQDILLTLTGKEIPCLINKVDTFFVFYTPLGPIEGMEKSLVSKITPQKLLLKDSTEKNVVLDISMYDFNGPYVFFREKEKNEKRKDRYNYFSYTINRFDTVLPFQDTIVLSKQETILYAQDSLHRKFEFTVEEQKAYTYGRRSARRNFTSPWSTLGGIASGFAGGIILNFFYAAAPAIVYCIINISVKPNVGVTNPQDKPYIDDEYFIEGYRSQARLLKVQNSVLGIVPSLILGIITKAFFPKN